MSTVVIKGLGGGIRIKTTSSATLRVVTGTGVKTVSVPSEPIPSAA